MWIHLTVAAIFTHVIPWLSIAIALQDIDSSVAGVITGTIPLLTLTIAFVIGHDRTLSIRRIVGFVLGFFGILVIFSPRGTGSGITSGAGLLCLISSISFGISIVYTDRYVARREVKPHAPAAGQLIMGTGLLLFVMPWGGFERPDFQPEVIMATLILGGLGTGVAYILYYQLIHDEGHTFSITNYLVLVIAVVLGIVVLAEPIRLQIIIGIGIVLGGVALAQHKPEALSLVVPAAENVNKRS